MATEKSIDPEGSVPDETTLAKEGAGEAVQVPEDRVWYKRLSEDWLATLVGLLLVLLIVVGLFHAIP